MNKKPRDYRKYPLRICISIHNCNICQKKIINGQKYYDGGYGRRVHQICGENWER